MKYLSPEFVSMYKNNSPNWSPIGELIYLRTYSRWLEKEKRREYWHETVARAVDFSMSLYPKHGRSSHNDLCKEAEQLFDLIWNLKAFPAGRTLWTGGTPLSKTDNGETNFNCAFTDVHHLKDFAIMVRWLMSGCGVGFRFTRDNLSILNKFHPLRKDRIELKILPYDYVGQPSTITKSQMNFVDEYTVSLVVGDSREGWAEAIEGFLAILTNRLTRINKIVINVNHIRPLGERLKRFGGIASGPEPLIEFFKDAIEILLDGHDWTGTKVLDIANMIGRMVVAGGSRRSSEIGFGDPDDDNFVNAKVGKWYKKYPWRSQSNNTMLFYEKPSKEKLQELFKSIMEYGEPAFENMEAALKRRPDFRGGNPCQEILFGNNYSEQGKGFCNLSTINLMGFVKDNMLNYNRLEKAFRLITRHALRMTNLTVSLKDWDETQKLDRLLGISFTGYKDMINKINLPVHTQQYLLRQMRDWVRDESRKYAFELRVPEPLLTTCVKPEGTLSLLPGVSSGIHNAFAPYYLRRVRISSSDSLAKALVEMGYQAFPDNGFKSLEDATTWVFEFPISSPVSKPAYEFTAIEQLETYRTVMKNYVEHNASVTIYIASDEVDDVINWLDRNWDDYVAISFLPKSNTTYPLMPYEQISKSQYMEKVNAQPVFDRSILDAIESKDSSTEIIEEECLTGACPIR